MNSNNNQSLDAMLKKASQKLGTDSEKLKSAASSGKIEDLLKNLKTEEAKKRKKFKKFFRVKCR